MIIYFLKLYFPAQAALYPSRNWTAQLKLGDNTWSDNAWFVDFVRISTTLTEKTEFNCEVGAWLQRGDDSNSSILSSCQEVLSRARREVQPSPDHANKTTVDSKSKNYVALFYVGGNEISLSFQSIMTFALLQLPAVSLAFYGIFCAFWQQAKDQPRKKMVDKITDSLLAVTIIVLPYCVTELFTLLLQFDFTENGLDFLIKRVKSVWAPIINKIPATFDLLKFLPNKDPSGRDRSVSNLLNVTHFLHPMTP